MIFGSRNYFVEVADDFWNRIERKKLSVAYLRFGSIFIFMNEISMNHTETRNWKTISFLFTRENISWFISSKDFHRWLLCNSFGFIFVNIVNKDWFEFKLSRIWKMINISAIRNTYRKYPITPHQKYLKKIRFSS